MEKISHPQIDFMLSKKAFNNFRESYNAKQDNLRDKLRDTHAELYYDLIRQYMMLINKHVSIFKDTPQLREISTGDLPSLRTNRSKISTRQHNVNGSTIYRRLQRLVKSGAIIGKVSHGPERDFELHLNAELLIFRDQANPGFISASQYLKNADISALQPVKSANCTLIQNKSPFNNKIIPVDNATQLQETNSNKTNTSIKNKKVSFHDNLKHKSHYTRATQNKPDQYENSKNTIKNIPVTENLLEIISNRGTISGANTNKSVVIKDKKQKLHEFRMFLAREFVFYMISSLFRDKSLFPGVIERTIDYVLSFYFSESIVRTYKAGNQLLAEYKWRIDKAKAYVERYNFDMSNIYPYEYIRLSNSGPGKMSFVNTQKWLDDTRNYLRMKKKKKQARDKLILWKQKLINEPTLHQYLAGQAYVKANIPAMANDYQLFAKSLFYKS